MHRDCRGRHSEAVLHSRIGHCIWGCCAGRACSKLALAVMCMRKSRAGTWYDGFCRQCGFRHQRNQGSAAAAGRGTLIGALASPAGILPAPLPHRSHVSRNQAPVPSHSLRTLSSVPTAESGRAAPPAPPPPPPRCLAGPPAATGGDRAQPPPLPASRASRASSAAARRSAAISAARPSTSATAAAAAAPTSCGCACAYATAASTELNGQTGAGAGSGGALRSGASGSTDGGGLRARPGLGLGRAVSARCTARERPGPSISMPKSRVTCHLAERMQGSCMGTRCMESGLPGHCSVAHQSISSKRFSGRDARHTVCLLRCRWTGRAPERRRLRADVRVAVPPHADVAMLAQRGHVVVGRGADVAVGPPPRAAAAAQRRRRRCRRIDGRVRELVEGRRGTAPGCLPGAQGVGRYQRKRLTQLPAWQGGHCDTLGLLPPGQPAG